MTSHPSNSNEQQKAGTALVEALSNHLGIPLTSEVICLDDGCNIQIDGYSDSSSILCEAWAHIGKPKGAQPSKVMSDALKMLFCEKRLGKKFRKVLLFSDKTAGQYFSYGRWQAQCLKDYGIEVVVLPLTPSMLVRVKTAQKRQYR